MLNITFTTSLFNYRTISNLIMQLKAASFDYYIYKAVLGVADVQVVDIAEPLII